MDWAEISGPLLVIFRETFEIALILGVVLAATKGIAGRKFYIWSGIGLGVLGSAIIAFFADVITESASGTGQELMNAIILLLASGMIVWTVVWMKTHAREMSQKIKQVGNNIREGHTSQFALTAIVALAIFREGSEMVLFSFGFFASGMTMAPFITGCIIGAIGGTVLGIMLYLGLIQISPKHFFTVTSAMLTLLAAGMTSIAAKYLAQGGYVSELGGPYWDTGHILSEESILGETLKVLVGYSSSPMGIQLVFYIATVLLVVGLLKLVSKPIVPNKAVTQAS
jgi:high-affinity iron transporter